MKKFVQGCHKNLSVEHKIRIKEILVRPLRKVSKKRRNPRGKQKNSNPSKTGCASMTNNLNTKIYRFSRLKKYGYQNGNLNCCMLYALIKMGSQSYGDFYIG
jgi:hypothetical protein